MAKHLRIPLKTLFMACLIALSSPSYAAKVSYSSITFRSADYLGLDKISVTFKDALVDGRLLNISVPLEAVEVILVDGEKNYTTLDITNADDKPPISIWLMAEKAIVVVRSKEDVRLWQKFLEKLKKKQEQERKERLRPRRVLPPEDL